MQFKLRHSSLVFLLLGFYLNTNAQNFISEEINVEELRRHVQILASDSLEGRKPGTIGSRKAADYIQSQFQAFAKRYHDSAFHHFEIIAGLSLGENNFLKFAQEEAVVGKDYIPLGYGSNANLKAGVVFAGFGLDVDNKTLHWNDYDKIDPKGKWVMIVRGAPDNPVDHKKYLNLSSDQIKIKTAFKKGAAGVLLVSSEHLFQNDKLMDLSYSSEYKTAQIPVLNISRKLANKILSKKHGVRKLENKMINRMRSYSYPLNNEIYANIKIDEETIIGRNVIGIIEGADSVLKNEVIVIGAHYDHLGYGGPRSGSRKSDTIAIHNGADDNASGVAALIEIGECLSFHKNELKRSVLLIAFDGEEMGLLGSKAILDSKLFQLNNFKAMFNFDMVGRLNNQSKKLELKGTSTSKRLKQIIDSVEKDKDFEFVHFPHGVGPSDHASFYYKKIPVLMITTGLHNDYHMPEDDVDKINFKGQKRIADFSYELIFKAAKDTSSFGFQATEYEHNGVDLNIGIIPDINSSIRGGMLVKSVSSESSAAKRGIKAGDIIIRMNDVRINTLKEYVDFLQKLKKGMVVTIQFVRAKKFKEVKIKL